MSVRPTPQIPKLVSRDPVNLSWDTIERLELDFDILNQHLDAKQQAVEKAVSAEQEAQRLLDTVFQQALMCVETASRPQKIGGFREKADFSVQVLKQLQIALKEERDKVSRSQRVFDYQKEELEHQTSRSIEQLKAENFKTRAKYRAAMMVLQQNNLSIDEELVQQEIEEKVSHRKEEYEDTLRIRMQEPEQAQLDNTEVEATDTISIQPPKSAHLVEQPNRPEEVLDVPVASSVETFNPLVKHGDQIVDTETGEVLTIQDVGIERDPESKREDLTGKTTLKETNPEANMQIKLNKEGETLAGNVGAGSKKVYMIVGHSMDELAIYEDHEIAEDIFKEISNTSSQVDENDKDGEDGYSAELSGEEDDKVFEMLDFIGKTGVFQYSDLKLGGINISDRDWRRYFNSMIRKGFLQARTVKSLTTPKLRIFALTDLGRSLVEPRIGRPTVESKIVSWVKDHANLEHAIGIYQLAEFFDNDNWNVEYRRDKTLRQVKGSGRLISPDLYIEKLDDTPGCRYIEFERGIGHTKDQLREWIDRRIEFSSSDIANRRWMIVVPTQDLIKDYYGAINQVWTDYYVLQGRDTEYGATFIFKSARKLFDDPNGTKITRVDTLPLGKKNPDVEYQQRKRGRR